MRKLILTVAVTLDGFIEGPKGEYDWCLSDQDYGLSDFFARIDTRFLGRKSYELSLAVADQVPAGFPKFKDYIFSTTLEEVKDGAVLIKDDIKNRVENIKNEEGKDIWLFGGAALTTSLMNLGLIDEMWLAVHPLLLGSGKLLFNDITGRIDLDLVDVKTYSTGLVSLTYNIRH